LMLSEELDSTTVRAETMKSSEQCWVS
jgi:hypothetical protein